MIEIAGVDVVVHDHRPFAGVSTALAGRKRAAFGGRGPDNADEAELR